MKMITSTMMMMITTTGDDFDNHFDAGDRRGELCLCLSGDDTASALGLST